MTILINPDQAAAIARQSLSTPYPNLVLAWLVDKHPRLVANAMLETGLHEAPELELVDEPAAELGAAVTAAIGHADPGAHRAAWAYHRFFGWAMGRREHAPGCICDDCTDRRLEASDRRLELVRGDTTTP